MTAADEPVAGAPPAVDRIAGPAPGWRLEPTAGGELDFLAADGTRHRAVELRRAFPLSAPEGPVAILATDGGELVWIESPALIPPPLGDLLTAQLARREQRPVIERIEAISEGRPAVWSVVIDHAPRRFKVAHPDDVSWQAGEGGSVTDRDGTRYRLPPAAALDARSRRRLERSL